MSTLNVTNIAGPSNTGTAAILSSINGGPISGARNRIINGDMRIDARNNGAAVTVNASALFYTVDRWAAGGVTSAGVFTVQRLDGQLPFSPSMLRVNVTSAVTPASGNTYNLQQRIEGLNVSDLAFGTSAARPVTLSFKVKSTLTGTFGGVIQNGAQNRSYPFTFSIPAANTTTNISITIPGDTSGTWASDNSTGMIVLFDLGSGSSVRGTAGAWSGSGFFGATGSVSLIANASNTLDISEVQLEAGSVATPFERRSYGQELSLCQRYYEKSYLLSEATGKNPATGNYRVGAVSYAGSMFSTTAGFQVRKRATATLSFFNDAGASNTWLGLPSTANRTVTLNDSSESWFSVSVFGVTGDTALQGHWAASAEL